MSRKDAFFFSHDSNAKDDPKIMLMMNDLGLEGYGFFWILVEILREQPDYRYPIQLLPVISNRYGITPAKATTVVSNYGLFQVDENEFFFSPSLSRRMNYMDEIKEKKRLAGLKSGKSRRQKALVNNSTGVEQVFNNSSAFEEHNPNTNEQTKQNETKQNETIRKENTKGCVDEILTFYKFNEITNPDKLRQAHQFATMLHNSGRLEYFQKQFEAYKKYKNESGEKVHAFPNFLGTPTENFEDGGWNSRNWIEEINNTNQSPQKSIHELMKNI